MPATARGKAGPPCAVGVDGCPAGWVAVSATPASGCGGKVEPDGRHSVLSLDWALYETLESLLAAAAEASVVVLDVPIGLTDGPGRACDREARRLLQGRSSSVFSPPMRPALAAETRAEATRIGQAVRRGGGLSAQAWNIVPKIKEADAALTPERQSRVREGHPEVAFRRLAGAPLTYPKKDTAGRAERLTLLAARGADAARLSADVRARHPKRAVADDDVLDACALAITGLDLLAGEAWVLGGGERDGRGLVMEICG